MVDASSLVGATEDDGQEQITREILEVGRFNVRYLTHPSSNSTEKKPVMNLHSFETRFCLEVHPSDSRCMSSQGIAMAQHQEKHGMGKVQDSPH